MKERKRMDQLAILNVLRSLNMYSGHRKLVARLQKKLLSGFLLTDDELKMLSKIARHYRRQLGAKKTLLLIYLGLDV